MLLEWSPGNIAPTALAPLTLTQWDGFGYSQPTSDGYMRHENPISGRVYWKNREGRTRGAPQGTR